MITVEYNPNSDDVGVTFDEEGADLLIEFLQDLKTESVSDHIHLSSGSASHNGQPLRPESYALSLKKLNRRPDFEVASMLTLVFLANT